MTENPTPDDALEQRLRAALGEEASTMTTSPEALALIRTRTARRRRWLMPAGALAAAATLTGVVALGAVTLGGGDDGNAVLTPAAPTASSPSATPSTSSSPSPAATPSPSAAALPGTLAGVPVYWLADSGQRPTLYREFRSLPDAGGMVSTAVGAMLRGDALDPDYGSLWAPGTRVLSTSVSGDVVTVDLSAQARTTGGGSEAASVSLQQLVWTATAAAQVPTARVLVEGAPVGDFWGAVQVGSAPIARAASFEVLGAVWIETPRQGATVGSPVNFGGSATVFEGTVSWQVLSAGAVVQQGVSQASEGGPGRGTWTASVTLAPGSYVLKAFESSARDGSETFIDTKDVTVG